MYTRLISFLWIGVCDPGTMLPLSASYSDKKEEEEEEKEKAKHTNPAGSYSLLEDLAISQGFQSLRNPLPSNAVLQSSCKMDDWFPLVPDLQGPHAGWLVV